MSEQGLQFCKTILERGDLPRLGAHPDVTYRMGIMGGTFDPIHNGHLVAAEQAFDDLELDVVVFMPAGRPAFKQHKRVTSGEDRYAMTLLATSDNPHFLASRFEVDREGITYTAETLELLSNLYPSNVELYFITGADAIAEIVTWRDAQKIAELAHVVGATRPGYDLAHAKQAIADSPYDFDVTYLEVPALAISSSYLRERVEAGQSLRYLTPDQVTGYIHKHHLYGVRPRRYGSTELPDQGSSVYGGQGIG
ncbi:MAG: nicotinate-nucleotide adenylyltransferase [Coriobacteriales bacterium]|nr:nicotinate-nucleotide adenylyltransferase [Coriobacteriales bacterium]